MSKAKAREIKNLLYEQVARTGKDASSPERLELIEILCQGEKSVDQLASAHLKELKSAHLPYARSIPLDVIQNQIIK